MSIPNPSQNQSAIFALQPKDREDGSRRLAFFAGAVASVNGRALQSIIDRSRSGEFGEAAQQATSTPFSDRSFGSSIKNLSAVFIYLAMVDQGENAPTWLHSFLSTSVRALDGMVDGPSTKEIMQIYEFCPGYEICSEAGAEVCRQLGVAQRTADFGVSVRQFLEGSHQMRFDILHFALTQPYEELDRKLDELRPKG